MEELKQELDIVFGTLMAISVMGQNVELMVSAKRHLRKAFDMVVALETAKEKSDG